MSTIVKDTKQRGFVTLDSCIRGALMSAGADVEHYERYKHFAIKAFRKFHFDLAQEVKTVKLTLTAWKAVELPEDYVDWAMIGVVVNNQIRVFTHDDRIPIAQDDEDGYPEDLASLETLPETEVLDTPENVQFWTGSQEVGQLYGLVAKSNGNGYYKFNTERREIQFAPSIKSDTVVYLEYIADAINPCEQSVVHVYAAEFIERYIHWQRITFSKASLGEKQMAKENMAKEWLTLQNRTQKITVDDVLDCARNGYKMSPWI